MLDQLASADCHLHAHVAGCPVVGTTGRLLQHFPFLVKTPAMMSFSLKRGYGTEAVQFGFQAAIIFHCSLSYSSFIVLAISVNESDRHKCKVSSVG